MGGSGGLGGMGGLADTDQEAAMRLVGSVRGSPTDPQRRVKQAVFLAQRLLEAEKQRDAARGSLAILSTQLRDAKRGIEVARENLTRAAQPTAYLVGKLREEEGQRAAAASRCLLVQEQLVKSQKRAMLNGKEAEALRERLEELLQSRGELETVKVMLAQMQVGGEREGSESGSEALSAASGASPSPSVESKDATPCVESKESSPPRPTSIPRIPTPVPSPRSPVPVPRDLFSTARALGLTTEQVEIMTPPPKSGISGIGMDHNIFASPSKQ
jgi:hypothetical protein